MAIFLAACGSSTIVTDPTTCEACLDSGGTWQPEASSCTDDCDLQDISCFIEECPGACDADECENCFSQDDCETATCTWTQQDEAMSCG
jgi:hypothetical protein